MGDQKFGLAGVEQPVYKFRFAPEVVWFLLTAVGTVLAEAMFNFDESVFAGDPSAWLVGVAAACVRALGGALVAVIAGKFIGGTGG